MMISVFSACSSQTDNADETGTGETTAVETSVKDTHTNDEIKDVTAAEVVSEMKIGWVLGNTLDATGGDGLSAETSWGCPTTTKAMIDKVKDAGFNVLRIPVTWMNHMGEAPDYTIDEAWLDRVQEVVNYGIDNGMYVIINAHHEDWYNKPTYENLDAIKEQFTALWTQLSDRFGGYDEHLIFEGMNEPRLKGTNLEWTGGDDESRDVVNQLDSLFVETVRNSGKNNDKRILIITDYAASSDEKAMAALQVPENDNKIIVSIHAYTPYNFALADKGTAEWSEDNSSDTSDIEIVFARMKENFIDKGIPAIIGEFGSVNRQNLDARCAHAKYYVSKAREYGIPCIWWDNNAFVGSGENFGLLVREENRWHDDELIAALMEGAGVTTEE